MATKPKAARGKVTRIEKIKRKAKELANKPSMNMSPGAMGGRTPRKFNPPKLTRSDLETLFKKSDEVATKIGGIMGTAAKGLKKEFLKDGGEVMDLTTEVDVE